MCLYSVVGHPKLTNVVKLAWKVFSLYEGKLQREHYSSPPIMLGRWQKAVGRLAYGPTYKRGFHAYVSKKDANKHKRAYGGVVVQVKLRGVHTIGNQFINVVGADKTNYGLCYVANEMLIPERNKQKRSKKS